MNQSIIHQHNCQLSNANAENEATEEALLPACANSSRGIEPS